jgi:ABC-2 type transport system permease protein
MAAALGGLAVGIGALPNFKEDNPSKIVSGFGGTLCLVMSFIYIGMFVALVAVQTCAASA